MRDGAVSIEKTWAHLLIIVRLEKVKMHLNFSGHLTQLISYLLTKFTLIVSRYKLPKRACHPHRYQVV